MSIPIIFLDCKTVSQAKSEMKPTFFVPVHHDLRPQFYLIAKPYLEHKMESFVSHTTG